MCRAGKIVIHERYKSLQGNYLYAFLVAATTGLAVPLLFWRRASFPTFKASKSFVEPDRFFGMHCPTPGWWTLSGSDMIVLILLVSLTFWLLTTTYCFQDKLTPYKAVSVRESDLLVFSDWALQPYCDVSHSLFTARLVCEVLLGHITVAKGTGVSLKFNLEMTWFGVSLHSYYGGLHP